jgi:hypothetical protein
MSRLTLRYRLRTLLIVLAIGPPLIALAWWYGKAALGILILALLVSPMLILDLLMAVFVNGFGALCHLIGRLPGGNDRQDTKR